MRKQCFFVVVEELLKSNLADKEQPLMWCLRQSSMKLKIPTHRKRTRNRRNFSSFFLDKHCFCVHRSYFDFVDMPSLCSARYICLAANSICFRYAQTRYDINPRSRSEHIECDSTYQTRQRISKICVSGFISMRTCSMAGTPRGCFFIYLDSFSLGGRFFFTEKPNLPILCPSL